MKKQIIALDLDDVIADSTEALRLLVNSRTSSNLTKEHYQVKDEYRGYYERVWLRHGLAEKVTFKELHDEMAEDQSHVPLLPGAEFAIGELSKKFNLIIITARNTSWERETRRWLRQKFDGLFRDVHFSDNYANAEAKSKGLLCRELGAGWLIDDNPQHCLSAIEAGIGSILFGEYGWHTDVPDGVIVCKDWPAVLDFFNERS